MQINDDYKIECQDVLNVVLFEMNVVQKGNNAGQKIWRPVAYCRDVKSALKTLITREINGTGLKDFETVVSKVDELMEMIVEFIEDTSISKMVQERDARDDGTRYTHEEVMREINERMSK